MNKQPNQLKQPNQPKNNALLTNIFIKINDYMDNKNTITPTQLNTSNIYDITEKLDQMEKLDQIEKLDQMEETDETDEIEFDIIEINNEFVEYIDINSYNMYLIPENVSISTMGLTCFLGTKFNVFNIYKYMILEDVNVVAIKTNQGMRCLNHLKHLFNSTNKNSGKNFFNQNTIIIRAQGDKFLNIKLFKNGSIQMTGCKDLSDANLAINKLINKFREVFMVRKEIEIDQTQMNHIPSDQVQSEHTQQTEQIQPIQPTQPNVLREIKFVENINNLSVSKFKINLINTNFGINYCINKEELFKILTSKNIFCRITPNHACVNIKYKIIINNIESLVSIFVFQTGNIIITGAKRAEEIRSAYNFIVQFLNQHKNKIIKKDISSVLTSKDLEEVLELDNDL